MTLVFVEVAKSLRLVMEKNLEKRELFLTRLQGLYPTNYQTLETALSKDRLVTFRLTASAKEADVIGQLTALGLEILPGPFENSFIVSSSISQTEAFKTGQLYIQGLASMFAVMVLAPKPDDKILDLCAAPGSKTTLIAQTTKHSENITAVESNKSRFFALKKNMFEHGFGSAQVILGNAVVLPKQRPELLASFDKVLVDVPCSNEGLLRNIYTEPTVFKMWNPKLPKKLSFLQKKLLSAGISMLKPGGELVYSTCTYEKYENEDVVEWALKRFPAVTLLPISLSMPENFVAGLTPTTSLTRRILPTDVFDGFFVAKFRK